MAGPTEKSAVEAQPVVVVTGGAGYIGSRVVQRLAGQFPVVSLDREKPRELPRGAAFFATDLTSDVSVAAAFESIRQRFGGRIASCVHLAAYYDFSGEPSPLYDELTVEGTRRILRQLREFRTEQFVFSSTLLVMQPVEEEGETITESSTVDPAWDYPRSKVRAEAAIRAERGGIPVVILRIAGVYDDGCHSLPIAQQVARIYEKRLDSYLFPGNAGHGQPYVHLEDLISCIERAVARRARLEEEEVFLIAEPDLMSYEEIQDQLGELIHGTDWTTIRIPKVVAKAGAWIEGVAGTIIGGKENFIKPWMVDLADDHYPVAIGRARQRLDWEPGHSLRDTLPRMIGRLKTDPAQWYAENKIPAPANLPLDDEPVASSRPVQRPL